MARGGRPDPDAPNDPESTRYRASVEMEEKEKWKQEHEMTLQTNLDPSSAVRLMSVADPSVSTVHAPDPMALVRDQLQTLQQLASPGTPSQQTQKSSVRSAGRYHCLESFHICPCMHCMHAVCCRQSESQG